MITLGNDGVGGVPGGFGRFRNRIEIFDIKPGTKRLVIPAGWNKIRVAVIGAGGGGTPYGGDYLGTAGGGGGGYAEKVLSVREGEVYMYVVGRAAASLPGGTSSFGNILSATGGDVGSKGTSSTDPKGGVGGAGTGGTTNTLGGNGGDGLRGVTGVTTGGGGGGASGHRYGNGGDGEKSRGNDTSSNQFPIGGRGGNWLNYENNTQLYDDGWGLGVTRYDVPLEYHLGEINATASDSFWAVAEGGHGSSATRELPNYGGGAMGFDGRNISTVYRGGIGGGSGGGGYNQASFVAGPGAVIIEVLE